MTRTAAEEAAAGGPGGLATIQELLNELNGNAEQVNRCSRVKSELLRQLQGQLDQMNELTSSPVLKSYFELLLHLERCQWKIDQHQMERSDIMSEMYLTQQIILNMIQMKAQNGRFFHQRKLELKKNLQAMAKLKQQQNENSGALLPLLRKLLQLRRPAGPTEPAAAATAATVPEPDAGPDPYLETMQHMKAKLALLHKHQQHNETCIRELVADLLADRQRLKQFYQQHGSELIRNKHLLDAFLRRRVEAQETQAKVCRVEEQIRHFRARYRDTMDRIRVLSQSIHQARGAGS